MTDPEIDQDQLLTVADVARLTSVKQTTVRGWRDRGVGPSSFLLVGVVRYRESVVRAWIAAQAAAAEAAAADRRTA